MAPLIPDTWRLSRLSWHGPVVAMFSICSDAERLHDSSLTDCGDRIYGVLDVLAEPFARDFVFRLSSSMRERASGSFSKELNISLINSSASLSPVFLLDPATPDWWEGIDGWESAAKVAAREIDKVACMLFGSLATGMGVCSFVRLILAGEHWPDFPATSSSSEVSLHTRPSICIAEQVEQLEIVIAAPLLKLRWKFPCGANNNITAVPKVSLAVENMWGI
jgi:hypothetical protein